MECREWWYHLLWKYTFGVKLTHKVYSKGHLCRVPHLRKLCLVQKYGGRYFEKVKRIYILSRSMEADILKKYCSLIYFIL